MVAAWIEQEMRTADLNDERLNRRLREVLDQFARQPTASIPAACGGQAELAGAYRLFDNPKGHFQAILQPHRDAGVQRVAQQPRVLLVQDTTEVDLTRPQQQVAGAGPLDGGPRRGGLLHLLHAFCPDGTPLGTLYAQTWSRPVDTPRRRTQSRSQRAATAIQQKESYRWVQALQAAVDVAGQCPQTRLVCVADSEADLYEVPAAAAAAGTAIDWIVRAGQDRALVSAAPGPPQHLRAALLAQPVLYRRTIPVRGRQAKLARETRGRRQPRLAREAQVAVRAASVTLRPPWRAQGKLPVVTVQAVLVLEEAPPAGDVAVEWLLLTSLPVAQEAQVRQVVDEYGVRWMVEVFFRVLKSGCRIEARRFEQVQRLWSCLAVYLIVTWRVLYLSRLGRSCAELDCEVFFEPAEWRAVWQVTQGRAPPPRPPALGVMIDLVGQLGGYVPRKNSPGPGPQTLWLGLQRTYDFALCWRRFGPDSRAGPSVV